MLAQVSICKLMETFLRMTVQSCEAAALLFAWEPGYVEMSVHEANSLWRL